LVHFTRGIEFIKPFLTLVPIAALVTARQFEPELSVGYIRRLMPFKNPGDLDEFIEALRALGLREESADEDVSLA